MTLLAIGVTTMHVCETFSAELGSRWRRFLAGAGELQHLDQGLRLQIANATTSRYSDAQLDDYASLPRRRFPWSPPLCLEVTARFSHSAEELKGTAGFGFWNDPFLMTGARFPALPRAAWFFYASAPSNLKLDLKAPGRGWKAATIDALRPVAGLLAPLAPVALVLMNLRSLYRVLWPPLQRALRVREEPIDVEMTEWHSYLLEWGEESSTFLVDGEVILEHAPSPRGPLGFVMWVDNQYMVATPWGRFRWGLLDVPGLQWLEVDRLRIDSA